ncbi:MAG: hypothetical protein R3F35_01635 [Myxococcota bacterium]
MDLLKIARRTTTNGEAVTSADTEGLGPMEQTDENDQGVTLDLRTRPDPLDEAAAAALNDGRAEDVERIEALFRDVLAAEDWETAARRAAEDAEAAVILKGQLLADAQLELRKAMSDRLVAERIGGADIEQAKQREHEAAAKVVEAKKAHEEEVQAAAALRDRLAGDHRLADALNAAQTAVDGLLGREREAAAKTVIEQLRLAAVAARSPMEQLHRLIGRGSVVVDGIELDGEFLTRLLRLAGVASPTPSTSTARLLDIASYVGRVPELVRDEALRVRGREVIYESSRGPGAPAPKWRPGQPLVLRNPRKGSVDLRFEGSDEVVTLEGGQVRDFTCFGVLVPSSREYVDSGMLELVG